MRAYTAAVAVLLGAGALTGCSSQQGCPQSAGDSIERVSVVEKGGGGGGHASGGGPASSSGGKSSTSGGSKAGTGAGKTGTGTRAIPGAGRPIAPLYLRPTPPGHSAIYYYLFHGGTIGQGRQCG